MGEPESAVEVTPVNGTELALAEAAERIVDQIARYEPPLPASVFNIYELLGLYNFGFDRVPKHDQERWTQTFALAVSTGGLYAIRSGQRPLYIAVFWRTKNPHVSLAREYPRPDPTGNYCYLGWHWNEGKVPGALRMLRNHMVEACPGIEFVAGHDNRIKLKKRRRGRLWVMEVSK